MTTGADYEPQSLKWRLPGFQLFLRFVRGFKELFSLERRSLSPFIIQKIPVRLLRRPLVRAQIEVAGRDQPVVAQDVLDMPDGAAVKKKCRRHGVTQHVCSHRLGEADHLSKASEPGERRAEPEGSTAPAHHKERLALILAPGHVFFDPIKRPRAEKEHPLFVAFAYDRRLPCLEIDGAALQRQGLRYPRPGAE